MNSSRPICSLIALVTFAGLCSGCGPADVPASGKTSASIQQATPDQPLSLPLGKQCTVHFRRDALGGAADLPVPPMTSSINGALVSISGTLRQVDERWIVLEPAGRQERVWVARSSVLLIKFSK